MPTEPTHTPEKAVHLIAELKRAEIGLDCAGMSESMRVADYASDLESGHPIDDVWAMMCVRYLPDNAGFLLSFLAAYQEDRKALATRAPSPVTALRSAPGGEHTPLPWHALKYPDCKTWTIAAAQSVASKLTEDDAKFIVHAVNNHAALLAALQDVIDAFPLVRGERPPRAVVKAMDVIREAESK